VASTDRHFDRGTRLGERRLREVGEEFRNKRLELGLSQLRVANAARVSRSTYSRVERGKSPALTLVMAARVGAVLGLDVTIRAYPAGDPIRDAGHAKRIDHLRGHVGSPLRGRIEVPLPRRPDRPELRRWDLLVQGGGERTGFELESRLYDAQAQLGRWNLKRRDDPVDHFVLVLADTRRNREVLELYPGLFADLPRLMPATLMATLRAGRHPPTGLVLLPAPKMRAPGAQPDSVADSGAAD
jgi:transcriptional regulator with XRE-family HTH domain